MKRIAAGALDVAYLDTGPAQGQPVILLHGFPYDVHAFDAAMERLAAAGLRGIIPFLRGYGPTRFRRAETLRSGQQAALAADLLALMDALGLQSPLLAGYDWGGRAACVVAALSPERVSGLVSCGSGYNVQNIAKAMTPVAPEKERKYWYWYYLNSRRGAAALTEDRRDLCRCLWEFFSPTWRFDDAAFDRTAASFDNPDFVEVVLHSYRYRIGEVSGDPTFTEVEDRLAEQPTIEVPTVVLSGEDDGVDPPVGETALQKHFTNLTYRALPGVGHNVPQEAPTPFADAVVALAAGEKELSSVQAAPP